MTNAVWSLERSRTSFRFAGCWCVLLAALLLLPSGLMSAEPADRSEDAGSAPVSLKLETSHTALSFRETDFYVRFRIKATTDETVSRQPLNIALVFDRSGSMNKKDKIGYVRMAGHVVADNLVQQDHIAMIAFNEGVQTLVPMHSAINRGYLHHRIDELVAGGNTNISGGLAAGISEVSGRLDAPGLHHVILLTDGLANRGIQQPDALVDLTRRLTREGDGITVTTIGVGTGYNESLLSRMAETGGGRFIHVASPRDIPAVIGRELGSLLAVAARNTTLRMKLPRGVQVLKVYGSDQPQKPGRLELFLGDMTDGQELVILARMHLEPYPSRIAASRLLLPATLTCDDVTRSARTPLEQSAEIERSNRSATVAAVLEYARLAEAFDRIMLAVAGMDRKLAADVLKFEREHHDRLSKIAWASRDQDFINLLFLFEHFAGELEELIKAGALHEHSHARARLQKDLHFRSFLRQHHRDSSHH